MVIFWGARSCGLPAARGLRPQAPAVLPRPCQQGAGRQRQQAARQRGGDGGLRPNARPRGPAPPSKQVPKWPRRRKIAGSYRPLPALPGKAADTGQAQARPRALEGGRKGTKLLAVCSGKPIFQQPGAPSVEVWDPCGLRPTGQRPSPR